MDAKTRFDTQVVGALPVVAAALEQWKLAEIVDATVPWEGDVPLGTLIEVLIVNRLLQPEAMYEMGAWAEKAGVADYYGLTAEQLNDDRLGRALERLADHASVAQSALTLEAVKTWKLKVTQVHYDISNAEFSGAYAAAQPDPQGDPGSGPSPRSFSSVPFPTYGHTKSGRDDVKQIQYGMSVLGDGAVPVCHLPLAGNTAEARTHVANLLRLKGMFPKHRFLYLGDSKLDTPENLAAAQSTAGEFLCTGAFTPALQEKFRKVRHLLRPVDYCPKTHEQRPPEDRDRYQGVEVADEVTGEFEGRKIKVKYRLLFVHSTAKAQQQVATRERHLAKIQAEFEQAQKILGKYSLKTEEAIRRRLEKARGLYSEGKLFDYDLRVKDGKFSLTWTINERALEERRQLDGIFVQKTNLSRRQWPLDKVLPKAREQSRVEKRFHHLKGPLAVSPTFLKNPKRIAGLLAVLILALTVMSLMEREVRKNLKGQPMYGIYPENRPSPAPTGPKLIAAFSTLCIVIIHEHGQTYRRLAQLTPVQKQIIDLLSLPEGLLKTFKRRCGM